FCNDLARRAGGVRQVNRGWLGRARGLERRLTTGRDTVLAAKIWLRLMNTTTKQAKKSPQNLLSFTIERPFNECLVRIPSIFDQ
ncbi:MAG: hypothetical protein AAF492_08230, partial [Verrucomicrobiota bacterium]